MVEVLLNLISFYDKAIHLVGQGKPVEVVTAQRLPEFMEHLDLSHVVYIYVVLQKAGSWTP